jgi:hypothetical protein
MPSRHLRRTLAFAGLAAAGLLAPAEASAARGFRVPMPKAGEISVARAELRAPAVRGMRVTNVRRLPRNLYVAGRLTRVRRTNRYIARVVALRKGAPEASARAAQDTPPFEPPFISVFPHNRLDIAELDADGNVLTDPDPVPLCFGANPGDEWTRFTPLAHPGLVPRRFRDELTREAIDAFCARPVPDGFANRFDTYDAIPFFTGAHRPFERNPFEHVFRVHGNEEMGAFSIEPPPGGEFIQCAGDLPCFIDSGGIRVLGPIPAGEDVDVNGRANVEIPRRLDGRSFPGDAGGPFNGSPRPFYIGTRFRF